MTDTEPLDYKKEKEKRDRWDQGIEMMSKLSDLIPALKFIGISTVGVVTIVFAAGITWALTTNTISQNSSTNEMQNQQLINHDARIAVLERSNGSINCKLDVALSILLDKIEKNDAIRKTMDCSK